MQSIGALELSSVGVGFRVLDEMMKAAAVQLAIARTICSGKYLIVVHGAVGAVEASVAAGLQIADEAIVDELVLPNVHPAVFPALGQSVALRQEDTDALGILESYSGVSILAASDAACKAAKVTLFRIHVAMALGGKGFCLMTGTVSDCEAAVRAGAEEIRQRGLLVSEIVIPRPSPELFAEHL